MSNLRSVKVYYDTGDVVHTSMAANLSNKQIRNYFAVGKVFNIGSLNDKLAKVERVKIVR